MTDPSYKIERFGHEQEPIVIIDDFFSDPEALRADAASKSYQKLGPFYPGIRAQANPVYFGERMALLTEVLKNVFDFQKGAELTECAYSLVTTRPGELMPIQSMPHYDGLEEGRVALLHYLSPAKMGGTAFYRHKGTGFETVTEARFETYKEALSEDVKKYGLPLKAYHTENSENFEQIGKVEACVNRCVIYRGITLHSGYIPLGFNFAKDPLKGRLTVNSFLSKRE